MAPPRWSGRPARKSTLLRLLGRPADRDIGTIRYPGRDVRDYAVLDLRREVALNRGCILRLRLIADAVHSFSR